MADIPNQRVARRVEHIMQSHSELDDTQTRAQMAACLRDGFNHRHAHIFRDTL